MPSFDIYALLKDIVAFFKRRDQKLSVLKYIASADHNPAVLSVTNMTDHPVTIRDFGFDHSGVSVSLNEPYVQCSGVRKEFPQTLGPRASLDLRIALGAIDLWQTDDCYFVDAAGKRRRVKAKLDPSAAR